MEYYRLDSLRLTGHHHERPINRLRDGSDPWKLNKIAASDSTDLLFIASITNIQGFILERGRNYEFGRLEDQNGPEGQPLQGPSKCALHSKLNGNPDVVLACHFLAEEINAIKCGYVKIDGVLLEHLVAVTDDGKVYVWPIHDLEALKSTPPRVLDNEVSSWSIALSEAHDILAIGGNNHTVSLFSLSTGQLIRKLSGHTHNIPSIAFSPCGNLLISGSVDESCIIWQVHTGEPSCKFPLTADSWGWGVVMLDASLIERDKAYDLPVKRGFRDRRVFWDHNDLDFALSSSEAEFYRHQASFSSHEGTSVYELDTIPDFDDDSQGTSDMFWDHAELEMIEEEEIGADEDMHDLMGRIDRAIMHQINQPTSTAEHPVFLFRSPSGVDEEQEQQVIVRDNESTTSWGTEPPRTVRGHAEGLDERVFHRLLYSAPIPMLHSPIPSVYDLEFPRHSANLAICMTQRDLFLFDPAGGAPILSIANVLQKAFSSREYVDWNVMNKERFAFLHWIPEFSCLLAGNQCGSLALIHFTRIPSKHRHLEDDEDDKLRLSIVGFPCIGLDHRSLKGLTVRRVPAADGGVKYFDIYSLHISGVMRIFRLRRDASSHCLPFIDTTSL